MPCASSRGARTAGCATRCRCPAPRLPPADIVRLLALLADIEPQLRRSGNPRLVVELLLLRWAMMDRTVELTEVLNALKGVGPSDSRTVGRTPGESSVLRDVVPSAPTGPTVRPSDRPTSTPTSPTVRRSDSPTMAQPADRPPEKGPLSVERLHALWPSVVAHPRVASPMLW